MKFAFIEQQRDQHAVRLMCKVLEVSHSGYYAWRTRPVSQREMANQKLMQQIEHIGYHRIVSRLSWKYRKVSDNKIWYGFNISIYEDKKIGIWKIF